MMDPDDCDRKAGVEMGMPGVESCKPFRILVEPRGEGGAFARPGLPVQEHAHKFTQGKRALSF